MHRFVRHVFVVAALAGALAAANPVLGWTEVSSTGTTGPHSLTDTNTNPGATCVYDFRGDWNVWELEHMYVNAPKIKAVAGNNNQKVAWTFTIQRRTWSIFEDDPGPWSNRYTSAKQFAFTDATHNAAFTPRGIAVNVPIEPGGDAAFQYRAQVKAIWYRANGTVQGTSTMRVQKYNHYQDLDTFKGSSCWDYTL